MLDIQHHSSSILHALEDPFRRKEFAKNDIVHLLIDWNSRTSSFEERGTNIGSQGYSSRRLRFNNRPDTVLDRLSVDRQKIKF